MILPVGVRSAVDGEDRHRAIPAIGHQHQLAVWTERNTRGRDAQFERGNYRRRGGFEVDDAQPVVGDGLLGVGGVDLGRGSHQGNALVGCDGHALRGADHGARRIDLAHDLGWRDAEIDNGDIIGRRVFDDFVHAINVDDFGVVRRHGELRARRGCNCEGEA
jgi:hypothetical protein